MSEGEQLHAAAFEPKRFLRYETGGHLFGDRTIATRLAADIVDWFDETLA